MSDPFDPIDAFVGTGPNAKRLVFRTGYTWARDDVINFLKDVSDNPGNYGVPDPQARQPDLQRLYNHINSLKPPIYNAQGQIISPGGVSFQVPIPAQQVLRTDSNPEPTAVIPWATNANRKSFFIIFDLLGVFLALLGPAPTNATPRNYFLPLVVVYARWCIVLSPGSGLAPTVAQITWVTQNGRLYPFLGTSAKGFAVARPWPDLVKRKRHCVLSDLLQRPYTAYDSAPERNLDTNGRLAGWNFGNCGETYPFLYLLTDTAIRNTCLGIALTIGNTARSNTYNGQSYWRRGPIKDPCGNCTQLLTWLGLAGRLGYFKLYNNPT